MNRNTLWSSPVPLPSFRQAGLLLVAFALFSCNRSEQGNSDTASALSKNASVQTGDREGDCWDSFGGDKWIKIPARSNLRFDPTVRMGYDPLPFLGDSNSTKYYGYQVIGPPEFFKDKQVWKNSEKGAVKDQTKFKSCWIEEKYLRMGDFMNQKADEKLQAHTGSAVFELVDDFDSSYLKSEPLASSELLQNPTGNPTEPLYQLSTTEHNPDKACLIVRGTRLKVSGVDSTKGTKEGHIFVKFDPIDQDVILGIVPVGNVSTMWVQPKFKNHWTLLNKMYLNHPQWKMINSEGKISDPTKQPLCRLETTGGWIFKAHFKKINL